MTVVDYNLVKAQLIEKAKLSARPGAVPGTTAFSGDGYWKNDLRGRCFTRRSRHMKRDFKVNHYMWNYLGMGVEVNELQMTNNADQSRTFVTLYMHHNVLYLMEATVPGHYPPPGLFTQSIALTKADGTRTNHGKGDLQRRRGRAERGLHGGGGPRRRGRAPVVRQLDA